MGILREIRKKTKTEELDYLFLMNCQTISKEREIIYGLIKKGASIREIGRQLGRSHSTISIELRLKDMNRDTYLMSEVASESPIESQKKRVRNKKRIRNRNNKQKRFYSGKKKRS